MYSLLMFLIVIYIFLSIHERNRKNISLYNLLTVLFSCDRQKFLNLTLSSFFYHLIKYDSHININFNFVDSATYGREKFVLEYRIKNIFYLNPNNPEYSYNMFFSYLHGDYVLFLEDDRPFIKGIEDYIFFPNFLEESIAILNYTDIIRGVILKQDRVGEAKLYNLTTYLGNHILSILTKPPFGYYYTNGPAIYKISHLLHINYFISEMYMARLFHKLKWYTGFTYKGIKCNNSNIFTTYCQGVTRHLGKGYSTLNEKERKLCKNYLY